MEKLKIAYLLAGGCAGCDTSMIDTASSLIDFLKNVSLEFFTPTLIDSKYKDLEKVEDKYFDIAFFSGNIRNEEHEKLAKLLRQKSKVLIAFGICASLGGVRGLVNYFPEDEILKRAYIESLSTNNPQGILPSKESKVDIEVLELPELVRAKALDDVVEVDYYVGGCPPSYKHIKKIFEMILENRLPEKGSWLTMGKAVCDVCIRNPIFQNRKKENPKEIKRPIDCLEEKYCFLEKGYLCLGAATQGDCGAPCPKAGNPCRGCGGPVYGDKNFAVKTIALIGSALKDPSLIHKIPDKERILYRYSFAKIFGGKNNG